MTYDTWKTTDPADTEPRPNYTRERIEAEMELLHFTWTEEHGPVRTWSDQRKLDYNQAVKKIQQKGGH